jgi:hypothetical protein
MALNGKTKKQKNYPYDTWKKNTSLPKGKTASDLTGKPQGYDNTKSSTIQRQFTQSNPVIPPPKYTPPSNNRVIAGTDPQSPMSRDYANAAQGIANGLTSVNSPGYYGTNNTANTKNNYPSDGYNPMLAERYSGPDWLKIMCQDGAIVGRAWLAKQTSEPTGHKTVSKANWRMAAVG